MTASSGAAPSGAAPSETGPKGDSLGPLRPVQTHPVRLREVQQQLPAGMVISAPDEVVRVIGVSLDSRTIAPGELYVALPGARVHGAQFAMGAATRGAAAALTDAAGAEACRAAGLPTLVVTDPRVAMAVASAVVFGPEHLLCIGITGTNGKTTTSFLVEAGLRAAGRHVGTIGTIGFRLDGRPLEATGRTTVTTPEAPDLHALLASFVERGADAVVMEVSSHGLALHRVDGVRFQVTAFLNLGRDHLDFHPTMDDYFEAKARLFRPGQSQVAVVNIDDEHGRVLISRIKTAGNPQLITTGFGQPDEPVDYRIVSWTPLALGSSIVVDTPRGQRSFEIALPGEYNVRNAVTALAILDTCGLPFEAAALGLASAQVPGRMQLVELPDAAPRVFVDFAHTPQAIASALTALPTGSPRVVVVGAGGDRDVEKRTPMGVAAAQGADIVIVTDDNPRTEDPTIIRQRVRAGAESVGAAEVREIGDRSEAIATALRLAGDSGVVAILGKGHEQGQDFGARVVPHDDVIATQHAWAQLAGLSQATEDGPVTTDSPATEGGVE